MRVLRELDEGTGEIFDPIETDMGGDSLSNDVDSNSE